MRIACSYCNAGLGHKVQMNILVKALTKLGHEVRIFTDGLPEFKVVVKNNEFFDAYFEGKVKEEVFQEFIKFKPEMVISDFEPFLLKLALEFIPNIPRVLVQVNHKSPFFKNSDYNKLVDFVESAAIQIVNPLFYNDLGPLIEESLFSLNAAVDSFKVCYYTPTLNLSEPAENYLNLNFVSPLSREDYLKELKSSRYFITSGGHSAISEALVLKKPVFYIPPRNHTAKEINAFELRNLGKVCWDVKHFQKDFCEFLDKIEIYEAKVSEFNLQPCNISKLIETILNNNES